MLKIGNKVYRNLQEQVAKNKDDIEDIKNHGGAGYTAGDNITIEDGVINAIDTKYYKHHITISVVESGEEPEYAKLEFDILSTQSEEFSKYSFFDSFTGNKKLYNYNCYFEKGVNGSSYGPTFVESATLSIAIAPTTRPIVSISFYNLYENQSVIEQYTFDDDSINPFEFEDTVIN